MVAVKVTRTMDVSGQIVFEDATSFIEGSNGRLVVVRGQDDIASFAAGQWLGVRMDRPFADEPRPVVG